MSDDTTTVHSTLAANRLDPSIKADGHMNAGQGVGGTSEPTIVKEGVEHLEKQGISAEGPSGISTSGTSTDGPATTNPSTSGTSNSAVHQEGIEHLKSQTFGSEPPASHASTSNAFASQPPASNPGIDDPTGGIAEGDGGVSSTSHIESPVHEENKTVIGSTVDSFKSMFGWNTQKEAQAAPQSDYTSGTASTSTHDNNTSSAAPQTTSSQYSSSAGAAAAGVGASAAAGAAYLTGSRSADNTARDLEQTKREQESAAGTSSGTGLNSATSHTAPGPGLTDSTVSNTAIEPLADSSTTNTATASGLTDSSTSNTTTAPGLTHSSGSNTATGAGLTDSSTTKTATSRDMSDAQAPSQSTLREQDKTADDVTTTEARGIAPQERTVDDVETTTGGDKQTTATTDAGQAGAGSGDVGETNKPLAAAGGHSGAVENQSAIPTAGGERLGEKHWGESKIVPDNPKPKTDSEGTAGVSSKDGQPTEQVKDNTAANTGGATGGPTSSSTAAHSSTHEKEGLVDKIKDKLHIGKKH